MGSSSESSRLVNSIAENLRKAGFSPTLWDAAFEPGKSTLHSLIEIVHRHDFGVFVFEGDDDAVIRGESYKTPRDNVIYESGLFASFHGPEHSIIVSPSTRSLRILSDLNGIVRVPYDEIQKGASHSEINMKMHHPSEVIIDHIKSRWSRMPDRELVSVVRQMQIGLTQLKERSNAMGNRIIQALLHGSISRFASDISAVGNSYQLPGPLYPDALIGLQRHFPSLVVQAVALIDQPETFWRQDKGREIVYSANEANQRVFVFTDEQKFEETWPYLYEHSIRYNAYAMSHADLKKIVDPKDFSILDIGGDKVVAQYEGGLSSKIVFTSDPGKVRHFEALYKRIVSESARIKGLAASESMRDQQEIVRSRLFNREADHYARGVVEMSKYILLDDYDRYESIHPYRSDMIERMMMLLDQHCQNLSNSGRRNADQRWRVLELGAGTGLFTAVLAGRGNLDVTAVELDVACFNKVAAKFSKHKNVLPVEADSRNYNPVGTEGQFDFVFSCFSDHHIRDSDKSKYFSNVLSNLKSDGIFICGEEFLRDYDASNPESRRDACRAYHYRIKADAESNGSLTDEERSGIIDLEMKAMDSGLEGVGDFKISVAECRRYLSTAGFEPNFEKVGPLDSDVGGVYVLWAIPLV